MKKESVIQFYTTINKLLCNLSFADQYTILHNISYAPHILLMTAEVNESQLTKFSFQFLWHWLHNNTFKRKVFCRIPVFYNSLGPK